ncbi:purine-nucleoside phosphorylase [Clostridium sp. Marseille-Q2269]|uniref:purine-nucleoside phosphorylase n=1 Tax=Clostridium sp. Marseille-Q2269 TaxID=2942205 RepID=UPI002074A36F|nr:purine-nucleoside phosphorylase [Clostridium sp. Marseille-Q2269]
MDLLEKINKAKESLGEICSEKIELAIILGSGLGGIVDHIENKISIEYSKIEGFPVSTVKGHAGELIIGELMGKKVLALNGRLHYYEGYNIEQVTFPIRFINSLGINNIIVSNAAGGMNPKFNAGDLMTIEDQINLTGYNPLIGENYEELGARFPDMSQCYNKELITLTEKAANRLHIGIQKGVYVAVSGPCYETPAELRMLRALGADAVGMSTVPEIIVASHMKMSVLGISCITDMALADNLEPLDHGKVVETANKTMDTFIKLIKQLVLTM